MSSPGFPKTLSFCILFDQPLHLEIMPFDKAVFFYLLRSHSPYHTFVDRGWQTCARPPETGILLSQYRTRFYISKCCNASSRKRHHLLFLACRPYDFATHHHPRFSYGRYPLPDSGRVFRKPMVRSRQIVVKGKMFFKYLCTHGNSQGGRERPLRMVRKTRYYHWERITQRSKLQKVHILWRCRVLGSAKHKDRRVTIQSSNSL